MNCVGNHISFFEFDVFPWGITDLSLNLKIFGGYHLYFFEFQRKTQTSKATVNDARFKNKV